VRLWSGPTCGPELFTHDTAALWHFRLTDPSFTAQELHHPLVLEANVREKTRILNSMAGAAKPGFGQRTVSEVKPRR